MLRVVLPLATVARPVLGSTAETKASGFSHWIVPGWVTPEWLHGGNSGSHPGTRLANCGPLPCTMPFPFAE